MQNAMSQSQPSPPLGMSVLLFILGFPLGTIPAFKMSEAKFGDDAMKLEGVVFYFVNLVLMISALWVGLILILILSVRVCKDLAIRKQRVLALVAASISYAAMIIAYYNLHVYDVSWKGGCSPPNISYNSYTGLSLDDRVDVRYETSDGYAVKYARLPWDYTALIFECSSKELQIKRLSEWAKTKK